MIKHIVSIKLMENYKEKAQIIKIALEKLPLSITEIKYFEVGLNISSLNSSYDLVLVSEFINIVDLDAYREHSEHLKVLELIALYKENSVVVDYQI